MHAMRKFSWFVVGLAWLASPAFGQTFSGRFDDPSNLALVSSDLGAPSFVDDFSVANNVALYTFSIASAGTVSIVSTGFASGGDDPYFTLFHGPNGTATFVDSNFTQAFSTGGDFNFTSALAAGVYQIALGTFANMSFAENSGSGTLADGFIGLGVPSSLGDTHYSLIVTTGDVISPVPEPSTITLMALSLGITSWTASRRKRKKAA